MLQDLIYIADRLNRSGFYGKANSIDSIIKKIAGLNSEETIVFEGEDPDITQDQKRMGIFSLVARFRCYR